MTGAVERRQEPGRQGASRDGPRILVVDDEQAIRRFLNLSLAGHGYQIFEASTAREALASVGVVRPDVIILDLGLPDADGIDVIHQLRQWSKVPIVILSVRDQEQDKIAALDAGADDYLTKPFGVGELLVRIRVAMRHVNQSTDEPIVTSGDLVVDIAHRHVTLAGRGILLTPTEYDLLKTLALQAGKVLTHRSLLREVWGPGYANDPNLLRVNISNLRHKIEPNPARPRHIVTDPGVGYRLALLDEQNCQGAGQSLEAPCREHGE
ncbi:MAG TPA: response regulator [bacterium]|nr:response regulator [bacterium]